MYINFTQIIQKVVYQSFTQSLKVDNSCKLEIIRLFFCTMYGMNTCFCSYKRQWSQTRKISMRKKFRY